MSDRLTSTSNYFIRIVRKTGYEESIQKVFAEDNVETALCVRHKGSRDDSVEHYHITVSFVKPVKETTLRARLNLIFTQGKGNGHMSIKHWDKGDKCNAYMFHEADAPIIVNKGYSEERIAEFRAMNDEVKTSFEEKQAGSAFGICLSQLHSGLLKYDEIAIATVYVDLLLDNGKMLPDPFALRRAVHTIMAKHDELGKNYRASYIADVFRERLNL